jgi:hypothetical protein
MTPGSNTVSLLSLAEFDGDTLTFTKEPSLTDFAVGQGRQARFAGQTNHWWSVLHHVFAGYIWLRRQGHALNSPVVLAWMLHDAHEAVTSDVPKPIVSEDLRDIQNAIDKEIAKYYVLPHVGATIRKQVKDLDAATRQAEAFALRPPVSREDFIRMQGALPDDEMVRVVVAVHSMFAMSASSADGWASFLVRWWTGRVRGLLRLNGGWGPDDHEDLHLVQKQMDKNSIIYGDLHDGEDEADD